MNRQIVLLQRKNEVLLTEGGCGQDNGVYVASLNSNIMSLGYTFSKELFDELKTRSVEYLKKFSDLIISQLEKLVGADVEYKPMYPKFPKQVMEMSEFELYYNALCHYFERDLHYLGYDFVEKKKSSLGKQLQMFFTEGKEFKVLNLGGEDDVLDLFENLLNAKSAYSEKDRNDLKILMQEIDFLPYLENCDFVVRENLAYVFSLLLDLNKFEGESESQRKTRINKSIKKAYKLAEKINSATDVLRICCALCGGDVSLSEHTKFKPLPRKIRRFVLTLFENIDSLDEDFSQRCEQFKMLFRYLHVDEFKGKDGKSIFEKTSKAINKVRDDMLTKSYYSKVANLIAKRDVEVVGLLVQRPGYFARKLDELLRVFEEDKEIILNSFDSVAESVSVKILFTLIEHFKNRTNNYFRVFFPKGNTSNASVKVNEFSPFSIDITKKVIEICTNAIINIFKQKPSMGKVYLSESLKHFKAPFVLRNLTSGSKIITRGSRIKLNDKNALRLFIWWKDDVDNDLSVVLFDKKWNYLSHISYTNLVDSYGCHSGDVTYQRKNGVEGECEFVDIDTTLLKEMGVEYVACEVHNFRGYNFSDSNCRFGFMKVESCCEERKFKKAPTIEKRTKIYPNTDELFNPLEVENLINLTAKATSMIPLVYDVKNNEIVWCDTSIVNNLDVKAVENTLPSAVATCYACVNCGTPSLYDILYLNIVARGEFVDSKEEADIIFDEKEGITPFDVDVITAEYIG